MTSLYEIAKEYLFLKTDLFDEETGEVNETSLVRLSQVNDDAENKCINIVRFMKDMEAEHDAVSFERKRLQAREKSIESQIGRLKAYLINNMEKCEIQKISCPQFVISLRKNPESVEIYDDKAISSRYHKISVDFNKSLMSQDLKAGLEVPGAKLVQRMSVSIR